ncbi:hypothetical protein, partial [Sphaerisporangium flaviroseum]|uniref:hypothetical protein n=1 Tax=Sphaerisporangium flaviroseum TaxID=509199 RepID=UPI0031E4E690
MNDIWAGEHLPCLDRLNAWAFPRSDVPLPAYDSSNPDWSWSSGHAPEYYDTDAWRADAGCTTYYRGNNGGVREVNRLNRPSLWYKISPLVKITITHKECVADAEVPSGPPPAGKADMLALYNDDTLHWYPG